MAEKKKIIADANKPQERRGEFEQYVLAGFPFLWIRTVETKRAIQDYMGRVSAFREVAAWDCQTGLVSGIPTKDTKPEKMEDPIAPIAWLSVDTKGRENTVLFLENFHHFIKPAEVQQAFLNNAPGWKFRGKCAVVVSSELVLPREIENICTVLEYELPDRKALEMVMHEVADGIQDVKDSSKSAVNMPTEGPEMDALLQAATGLTAFEAENAFALSVVKLRVFDPKTVAEMKRQLVKKNASLEFSAFEDRLDTLGGLDNLKDFALKTARNPLSRGLLLLGVPGTGKSHFCKGLGTALGVPTLTLDMGKLFGSLVGESESRIRAALNVVDAMAPCVLMIDEIEKGLSGIQSSAFTDGGTGTRVFGTFLKWIQDHKSRVYTVATCNNISMIPPEFLRAERWDAIFFVNLPSPRERGMILETYKKHFNVSGDAPDLTGWTGAEIRQLCRTAAMLSTDLKGAEKYVIPLSRSRSEEIEALRMWAQERTIPASKDTCDQPMPVQSGKHKVQLSGPSEVG